MWGSGLCRQVGHGSMTPGAGGGFGVTGGGSGGAATARTAEPWLFVWTWSFEAVVTPAVLVSEWPPARARTVATTRTVVVPPARRSSRVQVTVRPATEQRPSSAAGLPMTRRPAGRGSRTTTSRAVDGPALDTCSV